MKLNHVHFSTSRIRATQDFYQRYFGFRKKSQLGGTIVLTDDDGFLLAIDESDDESLHENFHFGFTLENELEVQQLHSFMKDSEVAGISGIAGRTGAFANFYCIDPAKNRIEVGWYNFKN